MTFAGFTYHRDRVKASLETMQRVKHTAKDFIGDSNVMGVDCVDNELLLRLTTTDGDQHFPFRDVALRQFAQHVKFDLRTFRRYHDIPGSREHLARLTTLGLQHNEGRHLVRTVAYRDVPEVRAWLSPRYRCIDNVDIFMIVANECEKYQAEIWDAAITETRMSLYIVAEIAETGLEGIEEINRWVEEQQLVPAIQISNSETGHGKYRVGVLALRKICDNRMPDHEQLEMVHLGAANDSEGWMDDEARRAEANAALQKSRSLISAALNRSSVYWQKLVRKLHGTTQDPVRDPAKAVNAAVNMTGIPKEKQEAILAKFLDEKDFSRYGLLNAVSYQRNDAQTDDERFLIDDASEKVLATRMDRMMAFVEE